MYPIIAVLVKHLAIKLISHAHDDLSGNRLTRAMEAPAVTDRSLQDIFNELNMEERANLSKILKCEPHPSTLIQRFVGNYRVAYNINHDTVIQYSTIIEKINHSLGLEANFWNLDQSERQIVSHVLDKLWEGISEPQREVFMTEAVKDIDIDRIDTGNPFVVLKLLKSTNSMHKSATFLMHVFGNSMGATFHSTTYMALFKTTAFLTTPVAWIIAGCWTVLKISQMQKRQESFNTIMTAIWILIDVRSRSKHIPFAKTSNGDNRTKIMLAVVFMICTFFFILSGTLSEQFNVTQATSSTDYSTPSSMAMSSEAPVQPEITERREDKMEYIPTPQPTIEPIQSSVIKGDAEQSALMNADNPDVSKVYLTREDVLRMSDTQIRYFRNEIYARHGYSFKNESIQRQFAQMEWYKPVTGKSTEQAEAEFNEFERRNIDLMVGYGFLSVDAV
jgi:uncharacterized protein YaaW (UPF0174 family)